MGAAALATPTLRLSTVTAARIKVFISVLSIYRRARCPASLGAEMSLFAREDNPDLEDWIFALRAEIWIGRLSVPNQIVDAMMARSLQEDARAEPSAVCMDRHG
jgi:hypothetical protein